MPPKISKKRSANLRPKPKRSAKAQPDPPSSGPSSEDEAAVAPERGTSSRDEGIQYDLDDQVEEVHGHEAIFKEVSIHDQGLGELLGEIRALQDSVTSLHSRHERTESRLKQIEGESIGRKRAKSHDNFSEEEATPSRRRSASSSSGSSSGSESLDSDVSRSCDVVASFGASIPIDAAVSEKVKNHIYKGKFIEFRYLLDPEERPTKQRKLQLKISAVNSEVHSVAAQEPGPLADFSLWDKAFHVFLAILMKSPQGSASLLDNLLIYRRSIHTMYLAGGDWERYDTKFRSALAVLPKQIKWQHRQYDLWDDCMRRPESKKPTPAHKPNTSRFVPSKAGTSHAAGVCYSFQNYNKCDRRDDCRFRHICQVCRAGDHGSSRCPLGSRPEAGEELSKK